MRWFGPMYRMDSEIQTKKILESITGGTMPRGRSTQTWNKPVGELIKSKGMNGFQSKQMAMSLEETLERRRGMK